MHTETYFAVCCDQIHGYVDDIYVIPSHNMFFFFKSVKQYKEKCRSYTKYIKCHIGCSLSVCS